MYFKGIIIYTFLTHSASSVNALVASPLSLKPSFLPATSSTANQNANRISSSLHATTPSEESVTEKVSSNDVPTKKLGLLTFDLDDTMYPMEPVLSEANKAFAEAMSKYGYTGIEPQDIVQTGKAIREEIALTDPKAAAILTHTEIRELAIRREMEKVIHRRKLEECAKDWATEVQDLNPLVVENAKKWANTALSQSVVDAVVNAWEMERHHAAERHVYQEMLEGLKEIKKQHPDVIIGAVTDGRANPLLMTFTLAPYFDFCMSWEDDQGGRRGFFTELASAEGNADLKWIYNAAYEKYKTLASSPSTDETSSRDESEYVWVHVGDDLAYDVGGSHACGAKTIWLDLDKKYEQTAKYLFEGERPSWSTSSQDEIQKRIVLNYAAKGAVNVRLRFLSQLTDALDLILEGKTEEKTRVL